MVKGTFHPFGARHGVVSIWKALAAAIVLMLVGASCTVDGTDDTETGGTGTEASAGEIDLASFCDGAIEGEAMFNAGPELDAEGNPTADSLEEFSGQLEPLLQDLEENAPEEISSDVETVVEGVRTSIEEGDSENMQQPNIFQADAAIDNYVFENCDLEASQELVAVDYAFEGVPENLSPGQIGIRLDNQGDEVHEAVIFRIDDETDQSMAELLELPEEEGEELAEFRGVAFAGPGDQGSVVVDLDEGRYAFVCFIPVGTTSMDALAEQEGPDGGEGAPEEDQGTEEPEEQEQQGPAPHFTEGMVTEFTVG